MSTPRYSSELERLQGAERELQIAVRVLAVLTERLCGGSYPKRIELTAAEVANAPDLLASQEGANFVLLVSR